MADYNIRRIGVGDVGKYVGLGGVELREIKFRGKQVDSGRWVYGNYLHEPGGEFIKECISRTESKIDPTTVGQYIGVHDKDDNCLYEGDIIRIFTDKWVIAVVKIKYGIPIFISFDFTNSYDNISEYLQLDGDFTWVDCEIIGNIHDNPELVGAD